MLYHETSQHTISIYTSNDLSQVLQPPGYADFLLGLGKQLVNIFGRIGPKMYGFYFPLDLEQAR